MKYLLLQVLLLVIVLVAAINIIGPAEEPLTELYFTTHTELPKLAFAPKSEIEFVRLENYSFHRLTYINETRDLNVLEIFDSSGFLNETAVNETFPFSAVFNERNDTYGLSTILSNNQTYRFRVGNLTDSTDLSRTYEFDFTIHNLEGRTVTYNYEVFQAESGAPVSVNDIGEVTLANDEYANITGFFTVWQGFNRLKVSVELIDRTQTIHFWVEEVQ